VVSGTLIFSGYMQSELKEESRETSQNVSNRKRAHTVSEGTTDSQSPASGGYISLVVHIWVGDDGRVIRGTIEDAHTGAQLAMDFSALAALLQESLASAGVLNPPGEEHRREKSEKMPMEGPLDV